MQVIDKFGNLIEQINNCEVTEGSLADHYGTVVKADSGPRKQIAFTIHNEVARMILKE